MLLKPVEKQNRKMPMIIHYILSTYLLYLPKTPKLDSLVSIYASKVIISMVFVCVCGRAHMCVRWFCFPLGFA